MYWLQGYKLERNAQLIKVRFDDVGTLAAGDKVNVSGVHRGKVNRLTLGEYGVEVELLIYRDLFRFLRLATPDASYWACTSSSCAPGPSCVSIQPSCLLVVVEIAPEQ